MINASYDVLTEIYSVEFLPSTSDTRCFIGPHWIKPEGDNKIIEHNNFKANSTLFSYGDEEKRYSTLTKRFARIRSGEFRHTIIVLYNPKYNKNTYFGFRGFQPIGVK